MHWRQSSAFILGRAQCWNLTLLWRISLALVLARLSLSLLLCLLHPTVTAMKMYRYIRQARAFHLSGTIFIYQKIKPCRRSFIASVFVLLIWSQSIASTKQLELYDSTVMMIMMMMAFVDAFTNTIPVYWHNFGYFVYVFVDGCTEPTE